MTQHILLDVHGGQGAEPVHAELLGKNCFRILYSPGFVRGVAAGDVVEMLDDAGHFRVVERGGNIAVQLFSSVSVAMFKAELEEIVQKNLKGLCDGGIERGLVFTIPVSSGFQAIEEVFNNFAQTHAGVEWIYGNVYDPDTNQPLGWWNEGT